MEKIKHPILELVGILTDEEAQELEKHIEELNWRMRNEVNGTFKKK